MKVFGALSLVFGLSLSISFACAQGTSKPKEGSQIPDETPFPMVEINPEFTKWRSEAQAMALSYYQPYLGPKGFIKADCTVGKDGTLQDVSVQESFLKIEEYANFLEACWSSAPLAPMPNISKKPVLKAPGASDTETIEVVFDPSQSKEKFIGAVSYFSKHPKQKSDSIALHSIPLSVSDRYKGTFSRQELSCESNVLIVKKSKNDSKTLANNYFKPWQNFFQTHRLATKKEIADFAKQLRKKATSP